MVLLCDNSKSMDTDNRMELLENMLLELAEIACRLTMKGVVVRFLNPVNKQWDDPPALSVEDIRATIKTAGIDLHPGTKLSTKLQKLIIDLIHCSGSNEEPIIMIIITDGENLANQRT
ncbi:hypothetical protein BDW69DRAFT_180520 [Aspergillus filifer]